MGAYYNGKKMLAYYNKKRVTFFLTYDIPSDDSVENATLAFLANMSLSELNGKSLSEL